MDYCIAVTKVDYLLIPRSLYITHVDADHRAAGQRLNARGTKGVFLGYRGTKNRLFWLPNGGRVLISPHVIA